MLNEGRVRQEVARATELLRAQRFGEARSVAAQALALAGDEPSLVLPAAFAAGEVERQLGDPARALPFFTRALSACQAVGVVDREASLRSATCHLAWANVASQLADKLPEAVIEVLDAADIQAARADDTRIRARIALVRARLRLGQEDMGAALAAATDAERWLRGRVDADSALLRAQAAEIAVLVGDVETAGEWLSVAWNGIESSDAATVAVLVGLARLALANGRKDDALEQARLAVSRCDSLGAQARLAAWSVRADCSRAVGLRSEAAACGWRLVALARERGARDGMALDAQLLAMDAWLDVEDWEAVEVNLPDAAALAGALDATRGGVMHVRKVSERRARWFVEKCSVGFGDMAASA